MSTIRCIFSQTKLGYIQLVIFSYALKIRYFSLQVSDHEFLTVELTNNAELSSAKGLKIRHTNENPLALL